MNNFCNACKLSSLIKEPTCYKNPENLSFIDLILTNSSCRFQSACVVETGLSDFHRTVVTIMKTNFQRLPIKIGTYRNNNKFYNHKFRNTSVKELSLTNTWNKDISNFIDVCVGSLDKHAPFKKKYTRGNHLPFINKELSKAITHRSKLRNNFLRNRSTENGEKYSKQQNYCVYLLRKIKKNYYSNLNEKNITDDKMFGGACNFIKKETLAKVFSYEILS